MAGSRGAGGSAIARLGEDGRSGGGGAEAEVGESVGGGGSGSEPERLSFGTGATSAGGGLALGLGLRFPLRFRSVLSPWEGSQSKH